MKKYDLKEYLNLMCLTQNDAAYLIGCSARQLRRVMNGESPAGYRLRKKLIEWGKGKINVSKLALIEKKGK